jgi:type VI protein secretion system component VasK
MWILSFIPDIVIHLATLLGVIALVVITFFDRLIPLVYRMPIKLGATAVLIIALFLEGANYNNNTWISRVKEMEAKVAIAEKQSKDANDKIDKVSANKVAKIKEKQVLVRQYIDREIVKYNETCVIPNEFVEIHNKAAIK